MIRKDYNEMILNRIEKNFDRILPLGVVVSWASAIAIYLSPIPNAFFYYNISIGLVFLLFTIYHKKLNVELKIFTTILVPIIIAILSFMDGGFDSAAIQLIMISNVVAVLFLSRRKSFLISLISVLTFIGLFIYSHYNPVDIPVKSGLALWFIQFIVFAMYLFILHTVVYSVRGYLLENIEDLQDSIDRTYTLAYYDQLTGLANQYLFRKSLDDKVKENRPGYLVIFNIRNLGLINSLYDDETGDQVLLQIAHRFSQMSTNEELLARISGNEFGLWIQVDSDNEFLRRIDEFQDYFYAHFDVPKVTKRIEFNISYKMYEPGMDIEEVYHQAKLALTYAKTRESHAVIPYDERLEDILKEESFLRDRLEIALFNKTFEVYYQAKLDAIQKKVVSVEALARWNDEVLGRVSPMVFIPALEKMNHAVKFGRIILKKVLGDVNALKTKYSEEIKISINISPSHLISKGFVPFVDGLVQELDINPQDIIFEITEEVMIENFEEVRSIFEKLRHVGFRISLDDFGSGYSSLNYLVKLDIDELKIDRSFVEQIETNNKIDIMFEMIMRLAHDYKLNVVAEGVETFGQYNKLLEMGCHEIQGYYFSRPEPIEMQAVDYDETVSNEQIDIL